MKESNLNTSIINIMMFMSVNQLAMHGQMSSFLALCIIIYSKICKYIIRESESI